MPAEAILETRVDEALKSKALEIFEAAGVSSDEVVRRLLQRTVDEQAIPLDLFEPSLETQEAMLELRSQQGKRFATIDELMADLHADD